MLYGVNVWFAAQGIYYRWAALRNKPSRWLRATTALITTGGPRIELRCDIRPDPDAAAAKAAGMPYAPEIRIRRLAKPLNLDSAVSTG